MRVDKDLGLRGVEHYLPCYAETHKYPNRLTAVIQYPLFRGYTFARIDSSDDIERARCYVAGVVAIIGEVTDEEMDTVRRLAAAGAKPAAKLVPGAEVMVRRGSLTGMYGTFAEVNRRGHLTVKINLLNRLLNVDMDAEDVELIRLPKARFTVASSNLIFA